MVVLICDMMIVGDIDSDHDLSSDFGTLLVHSNHNNYNNQVAIVLLLLGCNIAMMLEKHKVLVVGDNWKTDNRMI